MCVHGRWEDSQVAACQILASQAVAVRKRKIAHQAEVGLPASFVHHQGYRLIWTLDSATPTTTTAVATVTPTASDVSFRILPASTISSSPSSAAALPNSSDSPRSTAYVTVHPSPSSTSINAPSRASGRSIPSAVIAGAAVGGIMLIVVGVILFVCLKRRRNKSIYQAPIYVSPYNTHSDMSEHPKSVKAYLRSWNEIQQLDSSEIGPGREHARIASRCFAELPAEPVASRF